ncbi:MAG TPA: hypothetical protein VL400_19865, partial [Polyangiaceae bacterium]|nr:hypothetical protein [Polyangiaceae bacterium]
MSTQRTKREAQKPSAKDASSTESSPSERRSDPVARPRRAGTTGTLVAAQAFCADEIALHAATVRRAESAPS